MTCNFMKPSLYTALVCAVMITLSACSKRIYVPNMVNAPVLKEKYEFKGSITPTNLQGAFAITDNIGIMASGQYLYGFNAADPANSNDRSDNGNLFDNTTRGGMIEGGAGYFKPFGPSKKMVFDVYAGYGGGSFKTLAPDYKTGAGVDLNDYTIRNHFSKVFIQPSIGYVHRVVETVFTSRFTIANFYNSSMGTKAFENNPDEKNKFLRVADKPVGFYEPAFTVRVGYKYVKFQAQLQFSVPLNDNYDYNNSVNNVNSYFQPVAFNMGVAVNLAQWYNQAKGR